MSSLNTKNNDADCIFQFRNCNGRLGLGNSSLEVSFDACCYNDGSLEIDFEPVPFSGDSKFVSDALHNRSCDLPQFSLVGESPDRARIESIDIYIVGHAIHSDSESTTLRLRANSHDLTVCIPATVDRHVPSFTTEYWTSGLRSFGTISVCGPYGTVTVVGERNPESHARLNGLISIDSSEIADRKLSLEELDDHVEGILDLLSFAGGRSMRWSICKLFRGGPGMVLRFRGRFSSTERRYPMIPFLNLQEYLSKCIANYTPELRESTGLHAAINWLVMNPQFFEGEFISKMIALEHLLAKYGKHEALNLPLDKSDYRKKIKPTLLQALNTAFLGLGMNSDDPNCNLRAAYTLMESRIHNLNTRSLLDNIVQFVEYLNVPVSDLECEFKSIVEIRNSLVHNGVLPEFVDPDLIGHCDAVLRELLCRIILTIIKYDSVYSSFLDGYSVLRFSDIRNVQ